MPKGGFENMIVNKAIINTLFTTLIGTADDDNCSYYQIDYTNEKLVKEILIKEVKRLFDKQNDEYKKLVKQTLAYYLTTDKLDYNFHFGGMVMALGASDDPKYFYVWTWEVLFGDNSFYLKDHDKYIEEDSYEKAAGLHKQFF